MSEEEKAISTPTISFPTFLLKILASGVGGVCGSLVFLLVFVLASSLLTPLTQITETTDIVSPIFIFILVAMVFLASTLGNILSTLLLALTERDKYTKLNSTIYQVFIISVIIFLMMVPVYFITSTIDIGITAYAVAIHIIVSAQVSALIMEIVSNYKYALVGVYGVTFSILLSTAVMFGLAKVVPNPSILLFLALPVVWVSIGFLQSFVTIVYGWIARLYDKDFLSTDSLYGKDYGEDEVEPVQEDPQVEDEEGADFLRHNK